MKEWAFSLCLLGVVAVGFPAQGAESSPQEGKPGTQPVTDLASLISKLRAAGAHVEPDEEVDQPFFPVTGTMIEIHGEGVQVFEYSNAAAVEAQAALIALDGGSVGTAKPHWIGSPHFYKRGKLLALYLGDNEQVLKTLEAVLGRQFAGK